MGIKLHTPEEITQLLQQVEVMVGEGRAHLDAIREIGIMGQTHYHWRKQYDGMR